MGQSISAETKCTECIIFIVVMHITFQNNLSMLRWKVFLQYFNGVSAIYMEKFYGFTASDLWQLSVKYTCQETNLITFARFFVC